MGHAANLFYQQGNETTLHYRIVPSDKQQDEQQERWQLLAAHLIETVTAVTGLSARTWLQGSYKMATQIRPPYRSTFDIDLGLYFLWQGQYHAGPDPKHMRSIVFDALTEYADANPETVLSVSEPKPRCLRIEYVGSFHIDVPVYHLNPATGERMLATEDGWEFSDPKEVVVWFQTFVDEPYRSAVRRCVRYMKAWAALKFELDARPSSIVLTVLVAEAAQSLGDGTALEDDDLFAEIVRRVVARPIILDGVPNPADRSESLLRMKRADLDAFVTELQRLWIGCQNAIGAHSPLAAALAWQETFEHLFPLPNAVANLPASRLTPQVAIAAEPISGHGPRREGVNVIDNVPRNYRISFEITNSWQMPFDAEISWVVRNDGAEAENENDMGHVVHGGLRAEETTAYRGTHYMDCIVRHGGQVVGIQRVRVGVTGIAVPPRNPPSRPRYVGFG